MALSSTSHGSRSSGASTCPAGAIVSVNRAGKATEELGLESEASLTVARSLTVEEPWISAKNRFLEDLDHNEKVLFNKATLENLYFASSNLDREDREKSKLRVVIQKLQPLVSAIESFGKAFDIFSNVAPLYFAPLWGSIRVLLVVARSYGRFYEKFVETLSRIGDIIPRFRKHSIYSGIVNAHL